MNIDSIGFEDSEPATVTVTMSVSEAAQLTQLLGRLVPTTEQIEEMYAAFTSMLFNPYWEGGVADVPTPFRRLPDRIELEGGGS